MLMFTYMMMTMNFDLALELAGEDLFQFCKTIQHFHYEQLFKKRDIMPCGHTQQLECVT